MSGAPESDLHHPCRRDWNVIDEDRRYLQSGDHCHKGQSRSFSSSPLVIISHTNLVHASVFFLIDARTAPESQLELLYLALICDRKHFFFV